MAEVNLKQLEKEIIELLENFLNNPSDKLIKEKAKAIHLNHLNIDPVLPKELLEAKNILVDIAYNTGIKINKSQVKTFLQRLRK